ncbi:uncharacterized protein LOC129228184 [Uloborus diversus]|uniref:uncharacterized protein LOC129228184 n=1 Tax=Uloborus diversus TaxID=327109 RepID=UPI00240A161A|nr:uncharacterized protein LOC129228184 [Uloborus diversus]
MKFFSLMSAILIALITLTSISEAAENAKIGQPLLCHGCVAVIKELHKMLKDSSGRKKAINQSLNRLCEINNFVSYTFSPPKMIKACNYIIDAHKQELAENLIEYYRKFKTAENLALQEKFCDQVIKACEGVKRPTQDSEMKPHGFSMNQANEKLQNAAGNNFKPIESEVEATLEKPMELTTPVPHEEL